MTTLWVTPPGTTARRERDDTPQDRPTIADPAEAERFYNRIRTYRRRPGDADVDATELALAVAMKAHAAATIRVLVDEHDTPPGPDWRPDEIAAWVAARAFLARGGGGAWVRPTAVRVRRSGSWRDLG